MFRPPGHALDLQCVEGRVGCSLVARVGAGSLVGCLGFSLRPLLAPPLGRVGQCQLRSWGWGVEGGLGRSFSPGWGPRARLGSDAWASGLSCQSCLSDPAAQLPWVRALAFTARPCGKGCTNRPLCLVVRRWPREGSKVFHVLPARRRSWSWAAPGLCLCVCLPLRFLSLIRGFSCISALRA